MYVVGWHVMVSNTSDIKILIIIAFDLVIKLYCQQPAPEKPEIRASGPMTAGRDVTLECVTQSTSLPIGSRPEMRITWYRDGMIFTLDSQDDISIVDDKLEIEDLSGTMIHYYNCSALEAGSNIIVYSNGFPVVLLGE